MQPKSRPYTGSVRLADPRLLVVILVAALGMAIGVPVVVLQAQGADIAHGPVWLWPVVYAAFLIAFVISMLVSEHPSLTWRRGWFIAQFALATASVLLLREGLGFVAVVLVFGAALSCYVLPRWGTAVVVALNSVTVFVASAAAGFAEQATAAVFYLAIQIVSVATVLVWMAQERSQRRLAEAHVELAATGALLNQSVRAEERLRISRDLHDVAGHQLAALALELEIATHHAQPPASEHVHRARGIAKDLLADIRETVSRLREGEGSLEGALGAAIAGVTQPDVRLDVDSALALDPDRTTLLVRAAQETITNVIRHAESAQHVTIRVAADSEAGLVVFRAWDDGWGPRAFEPGNGLTGMRERAEALGGQAQFSRGDQGGFRVTVEVPVE